MSGVDSQKPSSADEATTLRDARLTRALEHAPDAHLRPDPASRAAVLAAARKAVEPVEQVTPAPGGWRAWLGLNRGGRHRMPWNAAFATILVAGFVTLLWRGEPVPEARMDSMESGPATQADGRAVPPAPAASPALPASPNIAESPSRTAEVAKPPAEELPEARPPAPAPAPTHPAKPAPALKKPITPAPAPAPAIERAPEPAQSAAPSSKAVERAPQAIADRAEEAEDARMAQSAQRESSSARVERRMESERARLAQPSAAGAAASALPLPASAAAPQAMAPRVQAAPSAKENSSRPAPSALPAGWTHLRRLPDGMAVARAQAGRLPQALGALRSSGDSREAAPAVLERIELQRNGQVLGVLELSGQEWRYLPSAPDEAPRWGIIDAAAGARLLGEVARLAPER